MCLQAIVDSDKLQEVGRRMSIEMLQLRVEYNWHLNGQWHSLDQTLALALRDSLVLQHQRDHADAD